MAKAKKTASKAPKTKAAKRVVWKRAPLRKAVRKAMRRAAKEAIKRSPRPGGGAQAGGS